MWLVIISFLIGLQQHISTYIHQRRTLVVLFSALSLLRKDKVLLRLFYHGFPIHPRNRSDSLLLHTEINFKHYLPCLAAPMSANNGNAGFHIAPGSKTDENLESAFSPISPVSHPHLTTATDSVFFQRPNEEKGLLIIFSFSDNQIRYAYLPIL